MDWGYGCASLAYSLLCRSKKHRCVIFFVSAWTEVVVVQPCTTMVEWGNGSILALNFASDDKAMQRLTNTKISCRLN